MELTPYIHEQHAKKISDWLGQYGIDVPARELFSDCGFVANGVAIGFLFKGGNSRQAYIDHVVADPGATPTARNAALEALFSHLEGIAQSEGFLLVTALAALPAMRRRFEGRGYARHGEYGLYFKVLGG